MKRSNARVIALLLLAGAAGLCWAGGHSQKGGAQRDKNDAAETGPPNGGTEAFDPRAVNQATTETASGGIRRVVANESSDAKQIGLIRSNLKALADRFGPGSFAAPSEAGGPAARAVAVLRSAAPEQLRAQYLEVRAGAEVRYSSADPAIAAALRDWLAAQP